MITSAAPATPARRGAVMIALIAASAAIIVFSPALDWMRGYALYHSHLAMSGRIDGQSFDLPPAVLRCGGCHEAGARQLSRNSELSLDLRRLHDPRPRRGGPPSAYTLASFCEVLRTGLDASAVVLARAMPRFALHDADCRALWIYLGGR